MPTDPLEYYAQPGVMTGPREYAALFDDLPREIPELCGVVQGLILHVHWAERYRQHLTKEREDEVNIYSVAKKLARIQEIDARPLMVPRSNDKKLVGNCRDFSVMLTAMLRHQGVPARARCGFGTYFMRNSYEDHWVVEYWNAAEKRWVMVDSQLDEFQRRVLPIRFNPWDMPPNKFIPAGQAFQVCRAGDADPQKFGIFKMRGLWFIRGDLARDFASLNKVEMLPWDGWGIMDDHDYQLPDEVMAFWDHIAALTLDNRQFDAVRELYDGDERLRVPPVFHSYPGGGVRTVKLADV